MRWLIVEDALRDQTGHWFEYISVFLRALSQLGDEPTVLADEAAEEFILRELGAHPVLPRSIWHRMNENVSPWERYWRVLSHAWLTRSRLGEWLKKSPPYDIVFVPTVLVHHLLGWTSLVKWSRHRREGRLVLFILYAPVRLRPETGEPEWVPAPTSQLMALLIRCLVSEVAKGQVVFATETQEMCDALTAVTGVAFLHLPQPVIPLSVSPTDGETLHISFGSYGGARHEKGSDLILSAVEEYLQRYPKSRARFALQCVGGDMTKWQRLEQSDRVRLISKYFAPGEYAEQLLATQVVLLPYRTSSYGLRGSRVAIEAMVNGIPMVVTRGTTLASQAQEFGASILCEDGDLESLISAMWQCENRYSELRLQARSRMAAARQYFSVEEFRRRLVSSECQACR